MKKLVFFSLEPGGVELLLSLSHYLNDSYDIEFYSAGLGAKRLQEHGFQPLIVETHEEALKSILTKNCPDFLITSATSIARLEPAESLLWQVAAQEGIPTLAFLDQWQNYLSRFSNDGKQIDLLPDKIGVIDALARQEMISEGFPEERLVCLGQPYLDRFTKQLIARRTKSNLHNRIGFASEPIREVYGLDRGYDQFAALQLFCDHLKGAESEVLIKLHPKEKMMDTYVEILEASHLEYRILQNGVSALEFLSSIDQLFGMSSIMLVQAYLGGLPSVSIQPNLMGNDSCVLTRHKLVPLMTSQTRMIPARADRDSEALKVGFDRTAFDQLMNAEELLQRATKLK